MFSYATLGVLIFCGLTKNIGTRTPNSRHHHLTRSAFRFFASVLSNVQPAAFVIVKEQASVIPGQWPWRFCTVASPFVVCSLCNLNWWTFHALCARPFLHRPPPYSKYVV